MKKQYKILFSTIIALTVWCLILSAQKYKYPDVKEIELKVNYLERILKSPLNPDNDIIKIGDENPEWMLFSLSFSTFALTNISNIDTSFREKSVGLIDFAIQKALKKEIYVCYSFDRNPVEPEIDINGSVLYLGHLNLMLGCYRLLSDDTKYNVLNDSISKSLFQRYDNSSSMCLQSYPQMIWIPDNTVGLASLDLHSKNTGSNYNKICSKWIDYAKANFIDEQTGLLCSTINSETGLKSEEPRGSMIGWSIFFIYRFNKDFAEEQYNNYTENFSNNILVFRLFRERYKNKMTDYYGDIDSGPIIRGYSIPANAFAFADAVAMNDLRNAKRLHRLIKLGSKEINENNEIKYKTRFVEMNVNPLSEALILYFETMTEWSKN